MVAKLSIQGHLFQLLGLLLLGNLSFVATDRMAMAQIVPDDRLGAEASRVRQRNPGRLRIDGGAIRGANLFHSFREFNINEGQQVHFANPAGIRNILSRVTGNNPSRLFGTLGVLDEGTANVFLINPNGILFGENARLDLRGSFIASTADAIQFGDRGFFSATNPETSSLLTIDPSALLFNQINTASIINQARMQPGMGGGTGSGTGGGGTGSGTGGSNSANNPASNSAGGLRVQNGRSLILAGGEIVLDGGAVFAPEGRVELAGIRGIGAVPLTINGEQIQLDILDEAVRSDVALTNQATVNVSGARSGSIQIQGRQVTVTDRSDMIADTSGNRDGGGIAIYASRLSVAEGGQITASTLESSRGNNGGVEVIASEQVEVTGTAIRGQGGSGEGERPSKVAADARGTGQTGGVRITTDRVLLRDGARISSSTIDRDNGGSLTVNARESVVISGTSSGRQRPSGLSVQTRGSGRAGDLTINTRRLVLREGGEVSASTYGSGNAGNLIVNATDEVEVIGTVEIRDSGSQEEVGTVEQGRLSSRLVAETGRPLVTRDVGLAIGTGDSGTVNITTGRLSIRDGGEVSASSFGSGDSRNVIVRASELVEVVGTSPDGQVTSRLAAETGRPLALQNARIRQGTGQGGNLQIMTDRLFVGDGAEIIADSQGRGRAGNLNVSALESVTLQGGRLSVAATEPEGRAGDLRVRTQQLTANDAAISVSSEQGQAGNLFITAPEITLNRARLTAEAGTGSGANIELRDLDFLEMQDNSLISAQAFQDANGGNITIDAEAGFILTNPYGNSDIIANAVRGQGGNIQIAAQSILGSAFRNELTGFSDINASSEFGVDGEVNLDTPDVDLNRGLLDVPVAVATPQIDQRCQVSSHDSTSRFITTGRGGLPPSPRETVQDQAIWQDFRSPQLTSDQSVDATLNTEIYPPLNAARTSSEPISEAGGWIVDENGNIVLIATGSSVSPQAPIGCRAVS